MNYMSPALVFQIKRNRIYTIAKSFASMIQINVCTAKGVISSSYGYYSNTIRCGIF